MLGLSVSRRRIKIGLTRQALSDLLNGKAGVSVDISSRLSKAFDSSPGTCLGLDTARLKPL